MADGRVNGSLNLSRALGDMEYKQNKELGPEGQVRWEREARGGGQPELWPPEACCFPGWARCATGSWTIRPVGVRRC